MLSYIKARLNERSTFMLIVAAISTAGMLPMPWSLVSAILGTIAAFIPDGPVKGADQ